jgi:hypothetical protein
MKNKKLCVTCHKPTYRYHSARYCWSCQHIAQLAASRAYKVVREAIARGILPKPDTLHCVDCKRPADFYDHRNYSEPLVVDSVCWSCNIKRGPALGLAA